MQYLLRSLSTSKAIWEAIFTLKDVSPNPGGKLVEYSSKLHYASIRSGNVYTTDENMTLFVDGLHPVIKSLVARQREKHTSLKFLELVQFSLAEGYAVRLHGQQCGSTAFVTPKATSISSARPMAKAFYAETVEDSLSSSLT